MPKLGMEPLRRSSLVNATIAEIGEMGSLDVTVGQIARRAGVSSALAHHYFGSKEQIFLSAMRHILSIYGAEVRHALTGVKTPRERVAAIVAASFGGSNFRPEVIAAWLQFYVHAQQSADAARLLAIYQRRLRSNLMAGLRPLLGARAERAAETIGALIDGVYIRQGLDPARPDGAAARALVADYLDKVLEQG